MDEEPLESRLQQAGITRAQFDQMFNVMRGTKILENVELGNIPGTYSRQLFETPDVEMRATYNGKMIGRSDICRDLHTATGLHFSDKYENGGILRLTSQFADRNKLLLLYLTVKPNT